MARKVGITDSVRFTCLEDLQETNKFNSVSAANLDYCGREDCVAGYKFGPYVRADYVMHIVIKGKGTYSVGGKTFEIGEGQAFLIYPEVETVYQADEKDPWSYTWVGFHGYRISDFVTAMGFTREQPVVDIQQLDECKQCILNMLECRQLTFVNEVKRLSELLKLFAIIMEDNDLEKEESDSHDYPSAVYVNSAIDYMMRNYRSKIKIDDLAEYIGISRSHLTGSFKKEMNVSPQEYLITLRMEKAAYMLKNTSEPINIVSSECGYDDSLSFSKVFKNKYGVSPKTYRETEVELVQNDEKGDYELKNHL